MDVVTCMLKEIAYGCRLCELVADNDVMLPSVSTSFKRGGHRGMRLSIVEIESQQRGSTS